MIEYQTTCWTSVRYAVVDVEGNGQQPPNLVELAIVPVVEGVIREPACWLVKPPRPITAFARHLHKISDADVEAAPSITDVGAEMLKALEGTFLVAHNAHVDLAVLRREPGWEPIGTIDTLKLARRLLPGQPTYRLGDLVEALDLDKGLSEAFRPHRAKYDALVTARLFQYLVNSTGIGPRMLSDLIDPPKNSSRRQDAADWETGSLF